MKTHLENIMEKFENVEKSAIVAVYETHKEADQAIRELRKWGFDMKKLSVIGKGFDTEQDVVGYYTTDDGMKAWGHTGTFWGELWTILSGSAFFFIRGIGPILTAGPLVGWIVDVLEGAATIEGLSALGAALYNVGIPKERITEYEVQIKEDKYLIIAHGSLDEVHETRGSLAATSHQGMKEYLYVERRDTEKSVDFTNQRYLGH